MQWSQSNGIFFLKVCVPQPLQTQPTITKGEITRGYHLSKYWPIAGTQSIQARAT
eukprot:c35294_g1_i1 orf=2-163(-)